MNKQELHAYISSEQLNICQIVAYKDGQEVYADEYKEMRWKLIKDYSISY